MRISKTQNGATTKYYWDRGYISNESAGEDFITNYIGVNGIFARESGENTDYFFKNGHGDVTGIVRDGEVIKTYDYDAYGKEINPDPADTNPFRYCGEYYDTESGQLYLRNRYYNSSIPRFMTPDPHWNTANMVYGDKEYQEGEVRIPNISAIIQSNNLYNYCMNNPLYYVDLLGELAFPGQVHNWVVNYIGKKYYYYVEQTILYKDGGWGRADLISETGNVWDVK